jgi:hypothetical protein
LVPTPLPRTLYLLGQVDDGIAVIAIIPGAWPPLGNRFLPGRYCRRERGCTVDLPASQSSPTAFEP